MEFQNTITNPIKLLPFPLVEKDDLILLKYLFLLYFYSRLNSTLKVFNTNFIEIKSMFEIFLEQNPNELEKIIMYAINKKLFGNILDIFFDFAKAGNIEILKLYLNRILKACSNNNILLKPDSLHRMEQLTILLERLDVPNLEILENINSFLVGQKKLAATQMQVGVAETSTPVEIAQVNLRINKYVIPSSSFIFFVLATPGALILSGIITLPSPTLTTGIGASLIIIGFIVAVVLVAIIMSHQNQKPISISKSLQLGTRFETD
jgi:hypothetical protein